MNSSRRHTTLSWIASILKASYPLIKKLLQTIGLEHSCETSKFPEENLTKNADKIRELGEALQSSLGVVSRNKKQTTAAEMKSLVNSVLSAWSGSTLKSECKRQRKDGKRVYTYTYYLVPESVPVKKKLGNIIKK